MADGEGFPDRSVAAQARNRLYSRGHLRRRQVELAEGNVELRLLPFELPANQHCFWLLWWRWWWCFRKMGEQIVDEGQRQVLPGYNHHLLFGPKGCRFSGKQLQPVSSLHPSAWELVLDCQMWSNESDTFSKRKTRENPIKAQSWQKYLDWFHASNCALRIQGPKEQSMDLCSFYNRVGSRVLFFILFHLTYF